MPNLVGSEVSHDSGGLEVNEYMSDSNIIFSENSIKTKPPPLRFTNGVKQIALFWPMANS
jgi:hypothetical protein